ncbi:hypothetical protein B0H11DRAFT_2291350 [Mycena galericulata]|nr:hypothetical protein B0H11DRAFT_2291350 [Mycena galericulata]
MSQHVHLAESASSGAFGKRPPALRNASHYSQYNSWNALAIVSRATQDTTSSISRAARHLIRHRIFRRLRIPWLRGHFCTHTATTAKTATPVLVVVIARDETETSSAAIGKKLNLKELRLASEDLLSEFFCFPLDKNLLCPLALNETMFPKIVTVVDSSIASSSAILFAVHALSSSSTVFLSGKDIVAYLRHLETDSVKLQELDLINLAGSALPPPLPNLRQRRCQD